MSDLSHETFSHPLGVIQLDSAGFSAERSLLHPSPAAQPSSVVFASDARY